jgi:hypothetical protein
VQWREILVAPGTSTVRHATKVRERRLLRADLRAQASTTVVIASSGVPRPATPVKAVMSERGRHHR